MANIQKVKNGEVEEITAQEISNKFKLPYSTINHYTNLGLFSTFKKSGNKRIYNAREVHRRYQVISKLVCQGYPLNLIRKKIADRVNDELL